MPDRRQIIIFFFVLLIPLFGCSDRMRQKPKYSNGEIIVVKLDNRKGMVIAYSVNLMKTSLYRYKVRFVAKELKTNIGIIRSDEPIESSPYSVVWMHDFEIEKVK